MNWALCGRRRTPHVITFVYEEGDAVEVACGRIFYVLIHKVEYVDEKPTGACFRCAEQYA